jgi:2-polyprenyl-6-methoxyphenol hydroxylase-like FAD-dependent oxidoreductase
MRTQTEMMIEPAGDSRPIVIVGAGPVGMALAMFLDFHGVPSILVDSATTSRMLPKGNTHNARTMEHYRRLGIAVSLRQLGLPPDHPTDVGYFTRLLGHELARIPMPSEREKRERRMDRPEQVVEPLLRANQMYVERWMFEHVQTLPTVTTRFGWRCVAWLDSEDGVQVDLEEEGTGRRERSMAPFLVGCDGGHSFLRRTLGIRFEGPPSLEQDLFGGAMLVSHLRCQDLYRRFQHKHCWQYWSINPEARGALVTLNGTDEFMLHSSLAGLQEDAVDSAVAGLFHKLVGAPLEVGVLGNRKWTAGKFLVAQQFGVGRVLLAGDAVHIFTPTGGFGMNTGIDDVVNLAWKLAAIVQGWGGPALLSSYQVERKPIAKRNTAAARQLAMNVGEMRVPDCLEAPNAEGAEARSKLGSFLSGFGEEFASIGVQLGVRYDDSPIIAHDGAAPPPDDPVRYAPSGVPGGRAPHVLLPGGKALFDMFGRGFSLLCLNERADTSGLENAAKRARVPLTLIRLESDDARELYGRDMVLVRPDQHVAWRGNVSPDDAEGLFSQVTGRYA